MPSSPETETVPESESSPINLDKGVSDLAVGKAFPPPGGETGGGVSSQKSGRPPAPIYAKQKRWDLFVLFNVALPILLILFGAWIIRLLGVAEAQPVPPPDASEVAVLQTLPGARVERIQSLAETGQRLELRIDGNVVPYQEAIVSSEVAGRVIFKSKKCEAGAIVEKDEVLMRIDPTDYELEVERLRRQREREYSALGEVDQEMTNTKRSIDVAREEVRLKQKEVERQTSLKRFTSQAELDKAKSGLVQASQSLVSLENQLQLQRAKRTRLEASEQLAATQLRVAEVNLERCEVRAPLSGVIVSEQADLNTFVNRGAALVTIEDISKVEVSSSMRMDQLHWVLDQQKNSDRVEGSTGNGYELPDTPAIIEYEVAGRRNVVHRWQGTLVSYDGIGIDPNTRTVPVRILVEDPIHFVDEDGQVQKANRTTALLRGMFVRVRLLLKPSTDLIVIPARALRPGNRVWRFKSDPAVLEMAVQDAKDVAEKWREAREGTENTKADATAAQSEATKEEDSEAAGTFDPSEWIAGKVTYSQTVYPVDSLRLSGEGRDLDDQFSPSLQTQQRRWVCEAEKSDLKAGDFVVVSPLDSIPPEGLPVRAKEES